MKRRTEQTSYEIPDWFRLVLATLCLGGAVGVGRFVSTFDSGEVSSKSEFSSEAPADYLRSPLAYADGSTYLDGRGRRFGENGAVDASLVTASYGSDGEAFEVPKENEPATWEQPADFVDDSEEERSIASLDLNGSFVESGVDAPTFDEPAASDSSAPGWEDDELNCDVQDLRSEWADFDKRANVDSAFGGADFDDQFEKSLVTDDLFDTTATTSFIGQTNATQEDATAGKATKGGVLQVSAETPAQPRRAGRYVSRGAVGGSGDVIIQIE